MINNGSRIQIPLCAAFTAAFSCISFPVALQPVGVSGDGAFNSQVLGIDG